MKAGECEHEWALIAQPMRYPDRYLKCLRCGEVREVENEPQQTIDEERL